MLIEEKMRTSFPKGLLLIVMLVCSCTVSMMAPYDESVMEQTRQITQQIDRFYLTMAETTMEGSDSRAYKNFTEEYIDIEVNLERG